MQIQQSFYFKWQIRIDKRSPKTTCKDRSTVDYFISSVHIFPFLQTLEVSDFNHLFSDAHCAISLSIDTNDNHNNLKRCQNNTPTCTPRLWDEKKTHLFDKNIAECELQNIRANLERVTVQNANQESINNIANQIENIFANSAKQSFGTRTSKTDNKTHKKWFDKDCKHARNMYHYTRRLYNKHKNTYFKDLLKSASKNYKSRITQSVKTFKSQRVEKLRNLKSTNPKEFWEIINSVDKKKYTYPTLRRTTQIF